MKAKGNGSATQQNKQASKVRESQKLSERKQKQKEGQSLSVGNTKTNGIPKRRRKQETL
jgi:hypothetical protein